MKKDTLKQEDNLVIYDVKEVSKLLGISIDSVRNLITKKDNLRATLIGSKYVIQQSDLVDYLNRHKWVK